MTEIHFFKEFIKNALQITEIPFLKHFIIKNSQMTKITFLIYADNSTQHKPSKTVHKWLKYKFIQPIYNGFTIQQPDNKS